MYFSAKISIDPAQVTKIEKVEPSKAFKKLLYQMTKGLVADKIEQETFTAVSILQQMNQVFRQMGITNIIRISQDDTDFYLDESGEENDLEKAMDEYHQKIDEVRSRGFNTLYLVLEHKDVKNKFNYLIEIRINRSHQVAQYPIEIKVNGLLDHFAGKSGKELKAYMRNQFSTPFKYSEFVKLREIDFRVFLNHLEQHIKNHIKVDDLIRTFHRNIIISKGIGKLSTKGISRNRNADDLIYHDYYGYAELAAYLVFWPELCSENGLYLDYVHIMSEDGEELGEIGEAGLDTAKSSAFDPESDFNPTEFNTEVKDSLSIGSDIDGSDSGGSFWGGDSSSDSGGHSCSSCSSCGGCGGGCG